MRIFTNSIFVLIFAFITPLSASALSNSSYFTFPGDIETLYEIEEGYNWSELEFIEVTENKELCTQMLGYSTDSILSTGQEVTFQADTNGFYPKGKPKCLGKMHGSDEDGWHFDIEKNGYVSRTSLVKGDLILSLIENGEIKETVRMVSVQDEKVLLALNKIKTVNCILGENEGKLNFLVFGDQISGDIKEISMRVNETIGVTESHDYGSYYGSYSNTDKVFEVGSERQRNGPFIGLMLDNILKTPSGQSVLMRCEI